MKHCGSIIALSLLLGLGGIVAAYAQSSPVQPMGPASVHVPGENFFGRLGAASLSDAMHTSAAPTGINLIGQPNSYNANHTPGSTFGLVNGAFSGGTVGSGPIGAAISGAVPGLFTPASSTPTFTGPPTFAAPSAAPFLGTPSFTPSGAPGLSGLSSMSGLPGLPAARFSGPSSDPLLALKPSATQPLDPAAPRTETRDSKLLLAIDHFTRGEYRECIAIARPLAQAHEAPVEIRQVYIACLVANGSLSLAAFEAVQAAKAYPRTLLTDNTFLQLYKDHPDFSKPIARDGHYDHVKAIGPNSFNLEPGILWAMYQRVMYDHVAHQRLPDPTVLQANDPAITLQALQPRPADKDWFGTLQRSLNKK